MKYTQPQDRGSLGIRGLPLRMAGRLGANGRPRFELTSGSVLAIKPGDHQREVVDEVLHHGQRLNRLSPTGQPHHWAPSKVQ